MTERNHVEAGRRWAREARKEARRMQPAGIRQIQAARAMLAALKEARFWVNETGHYLEGRNSAAADRALACVRMLNAAIAGAEAAGITIEDK